MMHETHRWVVFLTSPPPGAPFTHLLYTVNPLRGRLAATLLVSFPWGAGRAGGTASPSPRTCRPADDFNRVILSMKRGQEYTDYINASFIDVSAALAALRRETPPQTQEELALTIREAGPASPNPRPSWEFLARKSE